MATSSPKSFDFAVFQEKLVAQFRDLDPKDPSLWPSIPKYALFALTSLLIVVGLWFAWLSGSEEILQQEQQKEMTLREDYKKKLAKAVNLDVLKKQREQVQQYVTQLEKQLPSKAEIAVKEYYAELPITIRVTGRYHDIGAFASDIANLSRIVTLNNLTIAPRADNTLTLDSTAKTFRYLDSNEVASQRKATGAKK